MFLVKLPSNYYNCIKQIPVLSRAGERNSLMALQQHAFRPGANTVKAIRLEW